MEPWWNDAVGGNEEESDPQPFRLSWTALGSIWARGITRLTVPLSVTCWPNTLLHLTCGKCLQWSPWKGGTHVVVCSVGYGPHRLFFLLRQGYVSFQKICDSPWNCDLKQVPQALAAGVQNIVAWATRDWRCMHTLFNSSCYSQHVCPPSDHFSLQNSPYVS